MQLAGHQTGMDWPVCAFQLPPVDYRQPAKAESHQNLWLYWADKRTVRGLE